MLKVVIIGHIGQDAVIKEWSGQHFVAFSVAHSESYTDGNGVKHETTEWVSCLKRIKDANSGLVQYLKKGTQIYIEGSLSKKYFDKNGKQECALNCNVADLKLLGSKQETQPMQQAGTTYQQQPGQASPDYSNVNNFPPAAQPDLSTAPADDLPF